MGRKNKSKRAKSRKNSKLNREPSEFQISQTVNCPDRLYLGNYEGQTGEFVGKIVDIRWKKNPENLEKPARSQMYVLIRDIYSPTLRIEIDHIWIPFTDELKKKGAEKDLYIGFIAKIVGYKKKFGYDFKPGYLRNIRIMKRCILTL